MAKTTRIAVPYGLLLGVLSAAAFAQTPVNSSGRLLDANPSLGGSRINSAQPMSNFIGGNPYATGNVRGGMALRSFSPIGDPYAFRGSLGSTALSGFLRDSVAIGDQYSQYNTLGPTPFFDPSGIVPNVGSLRNQYQAYSAGQAQGAAAGNPLMVLPGLLNYSGGTNPRMAPTRTDVNLTPPSSAVSPLAPGPLGQTDRGPASLFGIPPVGPRVPGSMSAPGRPELTDPRTASNTWKSGAPNEPAAPSPSARIDLREKVAPIGATLDSLLRGDSASMLESRRPTLVPPTRATAADATARNADATPVRAPSLRDTSMLPGHDVFTDMRLALALSKDPTAAWWNDVREAMQTLGGTSARRTQSKAAVDAQEFVNSVLKTPIKTFVGEEQTPINDEMLKAEGLLHIGQYYDAASRFEQAHMLDPTNPLPLIGRGHALLAAGDYLSAAIQLVRGFERFPDLTRFDVDLRSFLGAGEIVDIRRSDIMKQLDRNEDSQLRFLLGYLEYFTGDRQRGLANLDKAAEEETEFGSLIRRFPDMLRGTVPLPLPKLNVDPATSPPPAKEPNQ